MVLQEYSGGPAVHLRGGERPRKTPVTHLSQAPSPSRRLGPFGRPSSVVRGAEAQNRKMTRIYSTSDRSLEGGVRPLVLRSGRRRDASLRFVGQSALPSARHLRSELPKH